MQHQRQTLKKNAQQANTTGFHLKIFAILTTMVIIGGCGSDSDSTIVEGSTPVDITNAIFVERSADCTDYVKSYESNVTDIQESQGFEGDLVITSDSDTCTFASNAIPNHNFNDTSANFATAASAQDLEYTVSRNPTPANSSTALTQQTKNGIMLNGVILDILSAGCYSPNNSSADSDGNVNIGCSTADAWLLDPLGTTSGFGADTHNAHVQPNGLYHYHGNPEAMFNDSPGPNGSPVIGFAADGYPIYGEYFFDSGSGSVRKAVSGYTLKSGSRSAINGLNPGGTYDGTYVADWEFTSAGDLDACNGMTVNGQYGYYVVDTYPWVIACFTGTPHSSFTNSGSGAPSGQPAI